MYFYSKAEKCETTVVHYYTSYSRGNTKTLVSADLEVADIKQKAPSLEDVIDLISDGDSEDETSKENKPRPRYGVRMYVQRDSDNFFLLLLEHVHHYNRY